MSRRDFTPIAESLRREVLSFYREREQSLSDPAGLTTLETNSGFVERRAILLLETLFSAGDLETIEGVRVLDLGCGFGALSVFFAAQGAEVTAVDSNEARLAVGRSVAAEHGLSVELRPGRMQALDLPTGSFDLAVQNNSLCYIVPRPERRMALEEARRVLRPGGFLIVRNPNRWHPRDQFSGLPLLQLLPPRAASRMAKRLGRERSTVRLTSPLEARRELRAAGFVGVRHLATPSSRWPAFTKPIARYQHLLARRPD